MEKAREYLGLMTKESETASRLAVRPHHSAGDGPYENFILRGIRVDRVEPGFVSCTFKDASGNLSAGAIASLVDDVGEASVHDEDLPLKVSVDMSISILSTAKANDELEITSRALGQKGGYSGTVILFKNKVTGELIAEGRHSLYGKIPSKI
uniref:Acyl-coenzyme A thioesterase 13 n=1 Tax=Nelumbo nucifera TaxID=4432 RepID=A0A822Y4T9_NELNU|nr:TPA_asm: hypothetical protein HUJ06_028099 [Nelumbo nucifera]